MSYKYKILADNPIGYWDFSSINSGSNYDITTSSNHALVYGASLSTPPLVVNSGSSFIFSNNSASIKILNRYDAFNQNARSKTFLMEFWLSLNGMFTGNGYASNSTASGYYKNNQLNIIKAINANTGSIISRIYFDYNSNMLRYNFPGSNLDSYYYIDNLDKVFHIIAAYSGGGTVLIVNGQRGTTGAISDFSLINTASTASIVNFLIDGSSLNSNSSSSPTFLLSNLAFYNYFIDDNRLKNHIKMGMLDDFPNLISNISSSVDYINPIIQDHDYLLYKKFSGKDFSKYNYIHNLSADNSGLSTQLLDDMYYYKGNSTYSINSSSGIYWSSSMNHLSFNDLGSKIYNNFSIFMTVSSSVVSSDQTLFSITNVNGNNTIYLKKNPPTKTGYFIYYFDELNSNNIFFASLSTTKSSLAQQESIGVSFDSGNVYLYGETASTTNTIPTTNRTTGVKLSNASRLIIGRNAANNFASATADSTNFYSYVGIYNDAISSHVSMSATYKTNPMILFPLISNLSSNQYGYAIYEIEAGSQIRKAYGSFIKWNNPDNLIAKISYDNGSSWYNLTSYSYVTNYNHSIPQEKILLKFEFNQNFSANNQKMTMSNLEFGLYDNISFNSDSLNYYLIPYTSSAYNTYSIKDQNSKIIHRPENFGINFRADETGFVPSYASIISSSNSSYGIDFWMRIDDLQKSASKVYLLNTSSYSLYYTASNPLLQFASATPMFVYINGASVGNNSFLLKTNEYYHIGISTSSVLTGNININGGVINSGASVNANATYGYFSIWNSTPSQTDIQNRYNLFVSNNIQTVSIQDNSQFIVNSGYYDTASAFAIG